MVWIGYVRRKALISKTHVQATSISLYSYSDRPILGAPNIAQ